MKWIAAAGLLFVGGALLFVAAVTAPPSAIGGMPPTGPAGGDSPGDPPASPPRLPAAPGPAHGAGPAPPEAVEADAGAPAPSAATLPLDPNERRLALEPLRLEVLAGLAGLEGRIAHCAVPRATLHVVLQSLDGAVRIVDTRLEPLPPSGEPRAPGEEAVDERTDHCLRSALAGNEIAARSARPGRRWEMPFDTGSWE